MNIFTTEWTRIQTMFSKKDKIRWNKLLQDSFSNFNNNLINIIFNNLTKEKVTLAEIHNPDQ
jgi:hypothetical protein